MQKGVAGNPVLIGAATLLVTIVAVFLAYNANQGLPFVPTYQLKAEAKNAQNLVRGNDVRIGGTRVGAVSAISVKRDERTGENLAVLDLKLQRSVEPLPKDSTYIIRPKSVLGLKYVQIVRGTSDEGFQPGDTIPVARQTPEQVEFDEVADVFDRETRLAQQKNLEEGGTALAGRGQSINQAIGEFRPLLVDLLPVVRNLSDPDTRLERLIRELGDAAAAVAPVAETQAELFGNLDTTFAALREVARPYIQESITEGPETLSTAVSSFRVQRPFLRNTTSLMAELRPGIRSLRGATPDLSAALRTGRPALRRSIALSRRTTSLLQALQSFAEDPVVPRGVRKLSEAVRALEPTLSFAAPSQTTCNYLALWFRNVASHLSDGDAFGTWQRFIIVSAPQGPNNEGGPSSAPANGPNPENHLHHNAYPNTAAPGQPRECEAGNEPYATGQTVIGNTPGTQSDKTEGTP
jgi:virulence factor Mce-like protein